MKTRFSFIDPGVVIGVIVALITLGVGTFAFFTVLNNIHPNQTMPGGMGSIAAGSYYPANGTWAWQNLTNSQLGLIQSSNYTSSSGSQVFNVLGVVMIIGAIMAIVGIVYNYVR